MCIILLLRALCLVHENPSSKLPFLPSQKQTILMQHTPRLSVVVVFTFLGGLCGFYVQDSLEKKYRDARDEKFEKLLDAKKAKKKDDGLEKRGG